MLIELLSNDEADMTQERSLIPTKILPRIAAGDQTAVEECLHQYGGLVWSLANRLLGNASDAEDVVQEIFVEIWKKAEVFDAAKSNETTFITLIARRRIIDRLRRGTSGVTTQSMSAIEYEIPDQVGTEPIELADEASKALECVRKLSSDQQRVIQLSVHHGISHMDISKQLSMPLGTVKSFARRAMLQLRECMNRPMLTTSEGGAS
ncbi:RNA polymerase sigma factor [Neorhodopirellula pilleata]|uniref:ECF RNA polymerase sigma factor SigK n=1 Tax=Neorhodopirellula pilleata TaxID=2714738 RepID=A0A5C6A835_9BACT|nr:sigma-70 family RNA polymerase sigma factor [Neorhodopirellula pilleata]TWT95485.1 ECF RNA polymerase sigma factor SigK [Neorhodopirellula pilleata]